MDGPVLLTGSEGRVGRAIIAGLGYGLVQPNTYMSTGTLFLRTGARETETAETAVAAYTDPAAAPTDAAEAFGELAVIVRGLAAEVEARAALLQRVRDEGYIDDYAGVRISAKGRRFPIAQAVVWNLVDAHGCVHGQAASFPA